jgi:hypothetical protein|tara:strand:+ start:1902 stop:2189 length:288 start_codon:yes stop_codon:yes gene_type:complete
MVDKKKVELLSEEQEKQLQKMVNDMLDIASSVIEEYEDVGDLDFDDLSSLSGSLTQIHEDSPFLDELLKGDSWKRVLKHIPNIPRPLNEDNDDVS